MAKKNRSRRKPQRGTPRSRGERRDPQDPGPFGFASGALPPPTVRERVSMLWSSALDRNDPSDAEIAVAADRLASEPGAVVDQVAEEILTSLCGALWAHGWQPAEVRRHARLQVKAAPARLVELTILADHADRPGQRIDERWAAQLAGFGQRDVTTRPGWFADWRRREGADRASSYAAVLVACHLLTCLPPLEVLVPPPGAPDSVVTVGAPLRSGTGDPMLERIRKLLAKAEATNFEEEAAALTAKAQELMTRHAIDEALLERPSGETGPRMIRIPVDAPYVDAKSVLLAVVASANRGRAIRMGDLGLSSVIAHVEDLTTIELLFTSLLVQAQNALREAGRGSSGGRTRSPSFRSSFLVGYADRIGERLMTASDHAVADAGAAALPVLRRREDAVEEFVDEHYGASLTASSVRGGWDGYGRMQGRRAADQARLDAGELAG